MSDRQFNPLGDENTPADWVLSAALELLVKNVYAEFNGGGAGSAFVPTLEIISDSGHTVGTYPYQGTVAAGASADVTWFPVGAG